MIRRRFINTTIAGAALNCLGTFGITRGLSTDLLHRRGRMRALSSTVLEIDGQECVLSDLFPLENSYSAMDDREPLSRIYENIRSVAEGAGEVSVNEIGVDRWGRFIAIVDIPRSRLFNAATVQEELVNRGLGIVAPSSQKFEFIRRLYALEHNARQGRRGVWQDPTWRIRNAGDPTDVTNGYRIVEGYVSTVNAHLERTYLNFGANYKRDVTGSADARTLAAWPDAHQDLKKWQGAQVQLRGWVRWINGPAIELSHPLQILGAQERAV